MNVEKKFNCKIKIGTGTMVSKDNLLCLVYIENTIIGEIFIDYTNKKIDIYDIEYQTDFKYDSDELEEIPLYELVFNEKLINFLKKLLNNKENNQYDAKGEKLVLDIFYDCVEKMLKEM